MAYTPFIESAPRISSVARQALRQYATTMHREDWLNGAVFGKDYWALADAFVAARRAGTIDPRVTKETARAKGKVEKQFKRGIEATRYVPARARVERPQSHAKYAPEVSSHLGRHQCFFEPRATQGSIDK
ncbi:hypothetical protein C8R45DRAFT_923356 [Mycena sanguinolenta]|nr:hypothetical protein C8R45DRAFT_923356 [Mycena sanguinolenta]